MERRTFLKGACGLVVLVAGAGLGRANAGRPLADESARGTTLLTTSAGVEQDVATGPMMQAGIDLVEGPDGGVAGWYGDTELFEVDKTGAGLIALADGSRSLDDIAGEAVSPGGEVSPADVASFFVTLGQAGYLQNTVLVNLVEIPERAAS